MATVFKKTSPYSSTPVFDNKYLDIMVAKTIPRVADDILFTITPTYEYRPDNLAYDLYGDPALWWVFAMRNKNALIDPIWDFKSGKSIYLPKKNTLQTVLGG